MTRGGRERPAGAIVTAMDRRLGTSVALVALLVSSLALVGATRDETRDALPMASPRPAKARGRVLFLDDFSSGRLQGWTPDRPGVWSVRRGMLRADLPDEKQLRSLLRAGDTAWTDVAVDLDFCMMRGVDKGLVVRVLDGTGLGVDVRGGGYQDAIVYMGEFPQGRGRAVNPNGTWNHLRIEVRGEGYRLFVNGDLVLHRARVRDLNRRGAIALPAYTGGAGECTVWYDNVLVTALD